MSTFYLMVIAFGAGVIVGHIGGAPIIGFIKGLFTKTPPAPPAQ